MRVVVFFLLMISSAEADDGVLQTKENVFHEIYKNFYSEPTPESSWENALQGQSLTYEIKSGDTLWDVSEVLFGDPYFWPKVWSLNLATVSNPHEVEPAQVLSFSKATMQSPPQLRVSSDRPSPVNLKRFKEATPIPTSLPYWVYEKPEYARKDLSVELAKKNQWVPEAQQYLTSFASNSPIFEAGEVVEFERGFKSASPHDVVFVKVKSGALGRQYSVIYRERELSRKSASAFVYRVEGLIKLEALLDPSNNVYRARVTKALHPISVGSKLVDKPLPTWMASGATLGRYLSASVVGGENALAGQVMGASSFIYIEGGLSSGVQKGSIYQVFKNQKARHASTLAAADNQQIANVLVVDVSGAYSTAFVLSSSEEISVGDSLNPGAYE